MKMKWHEHLILSSVESNKKNMIELTESLKYVYVSASPEMEDEVSEVMKQLRKSQNALKKAIDRKHQESECSTPLHTPSAPVSLSTVEIQTLAEDIVHESNYDYESVSESSLVSDSNPSSRPGSPVIPILSGLDKITRELQRKFKVLTECVVWSNQLQLFNF